MTQHSPSLDRFIEASSQLGDDQTLSGQREAYSLSPDQLGLRMPDGVNFYDENLQVQGHVFSIRHYQLLSAARDALIVYFHGGGWIMGDLNSHHEVLAHMTAATGSEIVAVDYPLAPENRHPVQLLCGYAVLETLKTRTERNIEDPGNPVLVAGDSAGGQLAAALCLLSLQENGPEISAQILIYPALNHLCDSDSYRRYADGPLLTADSMKSYWRSVMPKDEEPANLLSPLLEPEVSGLPPAIIQLAEIDVLHDEATAYGERLMATGTPVEVLDGSGMVHGFLRAIAMSDAAGAEFDRLCERIKDLIIRVKE